MNRFLKKEWEDTTVTENHLRQARDRAWSRFHSDAAPKLRWRGMAVAAGVAGAILLWALTPATPTRPPFESAPAPLPRIADALRRAPSTPPTAVREPVTEVVRTPKKIRHAAKEVGLAAKVEETAPADDKSEPESTRLVLNFRLPGSGVRLIWVQDPDFYPEEGETK